MVYTISDGLRDREYNKFVAVGAGSGTAINISSIANTIKTYEFTRAECTATTGLGSGLLSSYMSTPINGMLKGIGLKNNNYEAIGSLFLDYSGADLVFNVWNMISGTQTSCVSIPGGRIIKAFASNQNNASLSGTNSIGVWSDIPMYGVYRIVGSGLGNGTSCSGIILVYV
jgi:hypothetical protein